jgi:thymidylate synthase ThyX
MDNFDDIVMTYGLCRARLLKCTFGFFHGQDGLVSNPMELPDVTPITLELTYPRYIHAQFLMHRSFARNVASNRARPVAKTIAAVEGDPVNPQWRAKAPRGMQPSSEPVPIETQNEAQKIWDEARRHAIEAAKKFDALGVAKELANRVLEPFQMITTVASTTLSKWCQFIYIRHHPDAQKEISDLAGCVKCLFDAYFPTARQTIKQFVQEPNNNLVIPLSRWIYYYILHCPYVTYDEVKQVFGSQMVEISNSYDRRPITEMGFDEELIEQLAELMAISAARCARVSYTPFVGGKDHDNSADFELFTRLATADPPHASPLEHPAFVGLHGTIESPIYGPWHTLRHSTWVFARAVRRVFARRGQTPPSLEQIAKWTALL